MTYQEQLVSAGWELVPPSFSAELAMSKISSNREQFDQLLAASAASKQEDEQLVNFLMECFRVPPPLTPGALSTKIKEGGYQHLRWSTRDYGQTESGSWEEAMENVRKRALFGALLLLGRPDDFEQYLNITPSTGIARSKWVNRSATTVGEFKPVGYIVARWEKQDVWYTSEPSFDSRGEVNGYIYQLYYRNPQWVQQPLSGMFYDIGDGHWNYQSTLRADFALEQFGSWLVKGGPKEFFHSNLFRGNGLRRAVALLSGPSNSGKTTFVRALLSELGKDFVVFRLSPSQLLDFQYPTFLQNVVIWVEDIDKIIPPRSSVTTGKTEDILAKLEFNPRLESCESGSLKGFGFLVTANRLGGVDHAALQNEGRFDKIFFLEPGSWTNAGSDRLVTIVGKEGIRESTISQVVADLDNLCPEGVH